MKTRIASIAAAVALAGTTAVAAPFIYPSKGQTAEQQANDDGECRSWATGQSGFDPASPPPPPASASAPVTQGGVVKGGARGAAIGAVGGAIAGDAGKGAAIGAASGAMMGGMRRADAYRERAASTRQAEAQHASRIAAGQSSFDRAFAACMEGRGYTLK